MQRRVKGRCMVVTGKDPPHHHTPGLEVLQLKGPSHPEHNLIRKLIRCTVHQPPEIEGKTVSYYE